METLEGKVQLYAEFGGRLWQSARAECRSRELSRWIVALNQSHRELALRSSTLPALTSSGRHQRHSLELLQSHTRAIESHLLEVAATADELEAALEQRLAALDALRLDTPTIAKFEWESTFHPLTTLVMLLPALLIWTRDGFGACVFCVAVIAALTQLRTWLEFDGRSLRVQQRLFGLACWSSAVDLKFFNELVLTEFEQEQEKGGPIQLTQVSLRYGAREVLVGNAGESMELLITRLREWCAIASKEAELAPELGGEAGAGNLCVPFRHEPVWR